MCVKDSEQVSEEMENSSLSDHDATKLGNSFPVRVLFICLFEFLEFFVLEDPFGGSMLVSVCFLSGRKG